MQTIPKSILDEYKEISENHGVSIDKIEEVHAAAHNIEAESNKTKPKSKKMSADELHESAKRRTLVTIQGEIDTRSVPITGFLVAIDAARNMVQKQRNTQLKEYEDNPANSIKAGSVAIITTEKPTPKDVPSGCEIVATTKSGLHVISFKGNDNLQGFIEGRGINLPEGTYPLDVNEYPIWDTDKEKPNKFYGTPLPVRRMVRRCMLAHKTEDGIYELSDLIMRGKSAEVELPHVGTWAQFGLIPSQNKANQFSSSKKWNYSEYKDGEGPDALPFEILDSMISDGTDNKHITDILELEDFNAKAQSEKDPFRMAIFMADIQSLVPPRKGNSYIVPLTDVTRISDMNNVYGSSSITGFLPEDLLEMNNFQPSDRVIILGTTRKGEGQYGLSVSIQGIISSSSTKDVDLSSILGDDSDEMGGQDIEDLYAGM